MLSLHMLSEGDGYAVLHYLRTESLELSRLANIAATPDDHEDLMAKSDTAMWAAAKLNGGQAVTQSIATEIVDILDDRGAHMLATRVARFLR